MVLEYLKKEELATLLLVPTSLADAKMILARNEGLLHRAVLSSAKPVDFPCPHCDWAEGAFVCSNCAYQETQSAIEKRNHFWRRCICCHVPFAGATAGSLSYLLSLRHDQACLQVSSAGTSLVAGTLTPFLRAHLEWADVIIQLGDTCTKDWRKMTPEEQNAWRPPALAEVIQKLDLQFKEQSNDPALSAKE